MEIEYKEPKLKDKIYGEMYWEDWDEEENYWYSKMKDEAGEDFDLLIFADSPVNFLAVGSTHSIYKQLIENINRILDEAVDEIMKNSQDLFKKKRQSKFAGKIIKKDLRLFCIKIYEDLSSEVEFVERFNENEDPDKTFYALLDNEGNLIEAGISDL